MTQEPEGGGPIWQPPFAIGERFARELMFDEKSVREFAVMALDPNPLHLDVEAASRTRFGGLIASGAHSTSWLLGTLGAMVIPRCHSVGLEFDFKLRRAVPADRIAIAEWIVTSLEAKPSLNGHIMGLAGALRDPAGEVMVAANGKILLLADLDPPKNRG